MKPVLFLFIWLWAGFANSQTVSIVSGDHDGFSRLVLTLPTPMDWAFGRTAEGYMLSLGSNAQRFDLSDVYRRISHDRLAAVFADPQSGALQLGVRCACHAIPFELSPRQIVIDIRDGPAPAGSSFELSLAGATLAPLGARPQIRPKPRPLKNGQAPPAADAWALNWREDAQDAAQLPDAQRGAQAIQGPALTQDAEIRSALLWQLAKAAGQGAVELTLPASQPQRPKSPPPANGHIRIGNRPIGIDTQPEGRKAAHLTAQGMVCLSDAALAIADWARPGPVISEIGAAFSGLLGEFDRPDPVAVSAAVKYLLYLGFGAEARQLLAALEIGSADRALWETMAHILDHEPVENAVFAGMEVCDTSAALWASLAAGPDVSASQFNKPSILRSFSALPLHLRENLGPILAELFLAQNDFNTSRAIRDAILRATGDHGQAVALLTAKTDLATGQTVKGKATLAQVSAGTGPDAIAAAVLLVHQQASEGGQVSPDAITALAAYLHEARGGPQERQLSAALALAYATQDQFDLAFSLVAKAHADAQPVWGLLASSGSDKNLILNAIFQSHDQLPLLDPQVDQALARRLIALGFAKSALPWLDEKRRRNHESTPQDRLLRAEAALQNQESAQVLQILGDQSGPQAAILQARAWRSLNDDASAEAYAKTDQDTERLQAALWREDWQEVANLAPPEEWQAAIALLAPQQAAPSAQGQDPTGPLFRGRQALAESTAARAALRLLLQKNPPQPDTPSSLITE